MGVHFLASKGEEIVQDGPGTKWYFRIRNNFIKKH